MFSRLYQRLTSPSSPSEEETKEVHEEEEGTMSTLIQEPCKSGLLQITVHSGKSLRKADIFGKGDPYVVIKVNRVKIHTTVVKYGTDSPRFEESVHCILSDINDSKLAFEVYDKDMIGVDDTIGCAFVNLAKKPSIVVELAPAALPA
ncbi:hypothetical protein ACHWQZ_G013801 [Mnemiopsis leidyi]